MTQAEIHAAFARGELSPVQAAALTLDLEHERHRERQRVFRWLARGLALASLLAVVWAFRGCRTPGPLPPLPAPPCDPVDVSCLPSLGLHPHDGVVTTRSEQSCVEVDCPIGNIAWDPPTDAGPRTWRCLSAVASRPCRTGAP